MLPAPPSPRHLQPSSSSPTIHCFAYQQIHFQIQPEHRAAVGCRHVARGPALLPRTDLSGSASLQPRVTCHTCNVAQFVAFQTLKQEHRKSFLPCRHLAAPSYIINNTSSSIYHINDQHFNCSIFSLFSSSVAHCHWLHNSKLNSPHHTPAAQMTPGSHTEGHMISAV